jgi:hypothetical protein
LGTVDDAHAPVMAVALLVFLLESNTLEGNVVAFEWKSLHKNFYTMVIDRKISFISCPLIETLIQ